MRKNIKRNGLFAAILLLLCTCSTESRYDDMSAPDIPENTERREVLLMLKNKLAINSSSPRAIATAEENAISTLDVYVFGSETENGEYTFQQRFSYRDESSGPVPVNAEELILTSNDKDDASTTGLLSLKRGLFVKFYCIANDTLLINPATGMTLASKDLKPIIFNKPGSSTVISTEGYPTEQNFVTLRTSLLTGKKNTPGEVLSTPLTLSGAQITPLDLTDATSTSRLRTSFRLTRLAARFDIVNDTEISRFTIRSISMGNGRRGATFFPIAITGDTPARNNDLITYADREFTSIGFENPDANKGLSQGAFYSYPSPASDGGYLILKGIYQVNKTEQKEVSYQIPFIQSNTNNDGTMTRLDIHNNHRYTIGITRADDYHLDFTLSVADWADDGITDEYIPENKPGEITIEIPDAFAGDTEDDYDPVRKIHTISMSLKPGSTFDALIGTTSPLTVTKTYAGGTAGRKYDWLQIDELPVTRIATSTYRYTFSLKSGYILGRYPRATVRIFDALSGNESILYVDALSVPQPLDTPQTPKAPNGSSDNPNSFDPDALVASLYRITDSRTDIRISCSDGLEVQDVPTWLEVESKEQTGAETLYTFKLKDREVQETGTRVVFYNKKRPELKTEVDIELKDASIQPSFDAVGTDNTYTPPATKNELGNVNMKITNGNTCQVNATSMDGTTVKIEYPNGGPEWLVHDAEAAKAKATTVSTAATPAANVSSPTMDNQRETITFSLVNTKLAGAKPAVVTLVNKIGGPDYQFTIIPQLQLGTMEKVSSIPTDDKIGPAHAITLYKLPAGKTSAMDVKITSYGGSTLVSSDDAVVKVTKSVPSRAADIGVTQDNNEAWYTLTAVSAGSFSAPRTATLTHSNRTDATQKEEYTVKVVASDITGDETATLLPENGKTTKFLISSPLGFKATVTDYKATEGGKLWLKLNTAEYDGKENTEVTVTANNELTNVRPVTLTLTNNIAHGGNKTLTVNPVCAVPTLSMVASTANPAANSLEGTQGASVKLKLIRIAGSTIKLKATAIGGTKITDIKGVTVSNADGSYATDNEYQITLASTSTASGSFKVVNRQDATKVTTVTMEAPVPDIKANNLSVNAANNAITNIPVNSGAGLTASVTSWGSEGQAWFDFTTAKVSGGDQNVVIKQKADLSGIVMKPATIKLTNSLAEGTDKTITVTPTGFVAPTLSSTSGSDTEFYLNKGTTFTFTASAIGKAGTPVSSNTNIATVSMSGSTVTVTPKELGTCTITIPNISDNNKKSVYTVSISNSNITYKGKAVWYFRGVYIAPVDEGPFTLDQARTGCPSGWRLPASEAELNNFAQGLSGKVFPPGTWHWIGQAAYNNTWYKKYFGYVWYYYEDGTLLQVNRNYPDPVNTPIEKANPIRCIR